MTHYYIAAAYGESNYNSSTYGGTATQSTDGTNGGTSTGTPTAGGVQGALANTGFEVLLAVTLACLIIFVSLIVRFWRRKPAALATQEAYSSDDSPILPTR